MNKTLSFGAMSSRSGLRPGFRTNKKKTQKRSRNKAMSPKQLAHGMLGNDAPNLFGGEEDTGPGVWNTGEWRAVGAGRAKPPVAQDKGNAGAIGLRDFPQPPAVMAPPRQKTKVIVLLVLTLFCVLAALAQVWVRLRIVRMGYELSTEAARRQRLERVHQKLSVEHALLRNPKRIRDVARNRLGLRSPSPDEVKKIGTSSLVFGSK